MRVGFIGLGRMGAPMAGRIATAGHRTIGYDISLAKRQRNIPGVVIADGPAEIAENANIVVTSLPGPTEVHEVVYAPNGLLVSLKPAAILIETSTISPQQSRAIAADFAKRNILYLDSPISGGAQGARDGTLVAMVGGEAELLERARPVLSCFCKEIFHLGPTGSGNVMKLVIQSIFLSQMAVFLEAVSMGERNGIQLETLLRVVSASSAHQPMIAARFEKLRAGNFDRMFEISSAVKDLSLAEDLWRELDRPLAALTSALSDYRSAAASGLSKADLIAVRNWLNQ